MILQINFEIRMKKRRFFTFIIFLLLSYWNFSYSLHKFLRFLFISVTSDLKKLIGPLKFLIAKLRQEFSNTI